MHRLISSSPVIGCCQHPPYNYCSRLCCFKPNFPFKPKFSALSHLQGMSYENLGLKEKSSLKESCAIEGRVQREMVKIVKETLQWSRHVLFKRLCFICAMTHKLQCGTTIREDTLPLSTCLAATLWTREP